MFTLVCPQPRVRPSFCHRYFEFLSILILIGTVIGSVGCASLKAGTSTSQPIAISATLPQGTVGNSYNAVISVSGGTAPYSFSTIAGNLPPGLSISTGTGSISGMPKSEGTYAFTVAVADHSANAEGTKNLSITVKVPPVTKAVAVQVSPASVTLASGGSQQFSAVVSNSSNPAVTWAVNAGAVSSMGVFTAPSVSVATTIQLTATSEADATKKATASIVVTPTASAVTALSLSTASLPEATEGVPYTASLHASGGQSPYKWSVSSGSLPPGMELDSTGGMIQGIAQQSGTASFTAAVSDAAGSTVSQKLSIAVAKPNTGSFDGPAELPRVYINSSMTDTPTPGTKHIVSTSAELQSTLASAHCGDTITLQAGATFAGKFTFPAKSCDDSHWIVVRTSAPDSALPPQGTRITPCYAGVTSLPGRPALHCASTANVLAKIEFTNTGSGPIAFADGANHYRLVGLEITRPVSKTVVYNLISNVAGGASDHIVYDRLWIHGTEQDETTRGIMLSGSTHAAIVDSFFSDFHCVAVTGTCGDSQAIAGGLGDLAMGPYKIANNYLEAAGENIIFGGGEATRTPEDIEVRRNFFFKPMIWMKGKPGFVGGRDGNAFIVKNHFELKNGIRVLVEGNVMQNTWGGFTQSGFSILLTPKNQNGHCPLCVVHDITVRYNTISHVGNGITIGNGKSDSGALSKGAWNESLHDLVITDVDGKVYNGDGRLILEDNNNEETPLHNVAIAHVTGILQDPKVAMLVVGNMTPHPLTGFNWTNNIFTAGGTGVISTGGGPSNCAYPGFGGGALGQIERCFSPYTFAGNVLIGATGSWPKDNQAPSSMSAVMFEGSNLDKVSSFQLQSASPFHNAGTDGKNPGADVVAIEAAIAGVVP